jgi:hypothetical protein
MLIPAPEKAAPQISTAAVQATTLLKPVSLFIVEFLHYDHGLYVSLFYRSPFTQNVDICYASDKCQKHSPKKKAENDRPRPLPCLSF